MNKVSILYGWKLKCIAFTILYSGVSSSYLLHTLQNLEDTGFKNSKLKKENFG
jgi:hypothetical protein